MRDSFSQISFPRKADIKKPELRSGFCCLYREYSTKQKEGVKMCYLIAKNKNEHGCYALETRHGKHLAELKRKLNQQVAEKGVQLVTISRPAAYGEYAPYQFVEDENEFQRIVQNMVL